MDTAASTIYDRRAGGGHLPSPIYGSLGVGSVEASLDALRTNAASASLKAAGEGAPSRRVEFLAVTWDRDARSDRDAQAHIHAVGRTRSDDLILAAAHAQARVYI